jgi:hypothetical protein
MSAAYVKVEIATGRRGRDPRIHLSVFSTELVALSITGHGERTPTLLLTRQQVLDLRNGLTECLAQINGEAPRLANAGGSWDGAERRASP